MLGCGLVPPPQVPAWKQAPVLPDIANQVRKITIAADMAMEADRTRLLRSDDWFDHLPGLDEREITRVAAMYIRDRVRYEKEITATIQRQQKKDKDCGWGASAEKEVMAPGSIPKPGSPSPSKPDLGYQNDLAEAGGACAHRT